MFICMLFIELVGEASKELILKIIFDLPILERNGFYPTCVFRLSIFSTSGLYSERNIQSKDLKTSSLSEDSRNTHVMSIKEYTSIRIKN
jgi:hypothetical protein